MELNGFIISPEIKKLFKIKVDTPTAEHPVVSRTIWQHCHGYDKKPDAVRKKLLYRARAQGAPQEMEGK